ncbi:MAG: hypothetical protein Q8S52_02190, partial [Methylobacter sp.]|nr:hypothetical protein [Methylobacter sp.]
MKKADVSLMAGWQDYRHETHNKRNYSAENEISKIVHEKHESHEIFVFFVLSVDLIFTDHH